MDKVNMRFLHSAVEHMRPSRAFDETFSDFDLHSQDKRAARLLLLLQQLDESGEGLQALPERELIEVVSSAIRLSGFVDPIETRDVIAIVLDVIEMRNPRPESP
jgi:hypothetical protein